MGEKILKPDDTLITVYPIKSHTNTGQNPCECKAESTADGKSIADLYANFSLFPVALAVCLDGWALTRALVSPNRLISHVYRYLCRPALSTALCSGRPLHSTAPWSSLCPRSAESPVLTSCCRSPCSSRCVSWPRQRKYCSDWKRAEPGGEHEPVHWQTSYLFAWS